MHVTLAQYQRLTPAEKALVTSIDASIADDHDEAEALRQQQFDDQWDLEHDDETR